MKFNDHQLRLFLEVANSRSLRAAADKLGVTSAALSKQMRALEAELQAAVFRRHGRGMALTPLGERLQFLVQDRYAELDAAMSCLSTSAEQNSGHITIACVNTLAIYLLPDVIEILIKAHPQITVSLLGASSPEVVEKVARGHADLGLVYDQVVDGDEFIVHRLFMETLSGYRGVALDGPTDYSQSQLQAENLIVPPKPYAIRRVLEREFAGKLKVIIECNEIVTSLDLASRGLGLALLPEHLPESLITKYPIRRVALLGGSIKRSVVAITHSSSSPSKALMTLLDVVRQCAVVV